MTGYVFDAGALIAYERAERDVVMITKRTQARRGSIVIPAAVVGQVWRDGARQPELAKLLGATSTHVVALDEGRARAAGHLCGLTRTHDVIDAAVVMCAREHDLPIVTSDPADMLRLDPEAEVLPI